MPEGMTLLHLVVAALTFMLGSGADTLLSPGRPPVSISIPVLGADAETVAPEARLLSTTVNDQLLDRSLISGNPDSTEPTLVGRAAQADSEEPLDAVIDPEDDVLDASVQQTEDVVAEEPLDAPLDDDVLDAPVDGDEVLDAPVEDVEVLDVPVDDSIAAQPLDEPEPLDAPVVAEVVDQPVADVEPLDDGLDPGPVAAVPVAEPVKKPVPIVADTKSAPPGDGKLVTSVRKKGDPGGQVVVTAGRSLVPTDYARCDVAVAAGRATVGSDCDAVAVVSAHQPAIPRSSGSTALISTDNPSLITSRRDGVQIGEYPEPTLGDSIATTVRAAIFPDDVIVPDVLIVPGELTVAGNDAREDPIVLWRSELEAAAAETGVSVEILATAIRVTSNGAVDGRSATGGVGLMFVPVEELVARGVASDDWFDPATNIRVGAEILADTAAGSNVRSEAALASYLAVACRASDTCVEHGSTQMRDWIVHYRLRSTHVAHDDTAGAEEHGPFNDWPFSPDAGEETATDPFERPGFPSHRDGAVDDHPGIRAGGMHDHDEPARTAFPPWVRESQD